VRGSLRRVLSSCGYGQLTIRSPASALHLSFAPADAPKSASSASASVARPTGRKLANCAAAARRAVNHGVQSPRKTTNGEPRLRGALGSRPVSRILSRVTIHLCGLPGSSAGSVYGACSPCTGRGLASRRVATTLVGSYPTVSPLPAVSPETRRRRFAFCATFRRLSPPPSRERPALRCPDFPRRRRRRRDHPACTEIVASGTWTFRRAQRGFARCTSPARRSCCRTRGTR
jgi:hypothetical protein